MDEIVIGVTIDSGECIQELDNQLDRLKAKIKEVNAELNALTSSHREINLVVDVKS